jgi:hypothetical protein
MRVVEKAAERGGANDQHHAGERATQNVDGEPGVVDRTIRPIGPNDRALDAEAGY